MLFLDPAQDPRQDAVFAKGLRAVPTVLGVDINTTSGGNLGIEPVASTLLPFTANTGYTTVDNPGGWTLSQPFPLVTTDASGKEQTYLSLAGATVQQFTGKKFSAYQ